MARSKRKRTSGNDFTTLPVREGIEAHQQLRQPSRKDASACSGVALSVGGKPLQVLSREPAPTQAVSKKLHPASTSPGERGHRKSPALFPRPTRFDSFRSPGKSNKLQSPSPSPASTRLGRQGKTGAGGRGSPAGDFSTPALPRRLAPLRQALNHKHSPLQHAHGNSAGVAKLRHLEKIAAWAAARVPSLGALYGVRLKRTSEASGISSPVLDSLCERCQTFLIPDVNCSVNSPRDKRTKKRRSTKVKPGPSKSLRNVVQYKCQRCNHDNWKSGSLQQEAKAKSAQAAAREQMEDEAKNNAIIPTSSCIQEGQICLPSQEKQWTPLEGQSLSTGDGQVDDSAQNHGKPNLQAEADADPKSLPSGNEDEMRRRIGSDCSATDEVHPALTQRVGKNCAEADDQFATPPAPSITTSGMPLSSEPDPQPEKPSTRKRKRKGWTSLRSIATSSLDKSLPKPKRLGFALDSSSPLTVRQPK